MSDIVDLVKRSLAAETATEFLDRVEDQAAGLRTAMEQGELDNEDFAVGMEMEVYAVEAGADTAPDGGPATGASEETGGPALTRLPGAVFDDGVSKELGLHNAEVNTDPTVLDPEGFAAQADRMAAQVEKARERARDAEADLVLDAMWTGPPPSGSAAYLGDAEERDGVTIAQNMRPDPRYVALDNEALRLAGGDLNLSVPGAERSFPTILFESLATSIQPHLQIPSAEAFPAHYNAAIRTLGPLLALSTNSPFLPPDLYTDVDDPRQLLADTHHELRIAVFEQSVNQSPNDKVRVPADIDRPAETVDAVVADDLYAPFLREWTTDEERDAFAEDIWEFRYKRSTYWRWLRCVIGGDAVEGAGDERSVRIEYRPLPTQPTVRDVVGLQALTVGLVRGLVARDHPLADLPWAAAERSFYDAARNGLDADLAWVTAEGERTDDSAVVFDEVFDVARAGLAESGFSERQADRYLDPIEARWNARTTPSAWKIEQVRAALDEGHTFEAAVGAMQRRYVERSRETESFAEWL